MSFTGRTALQREYIRTFLPVDVSREAKFGDDLEGLLAQANAVLRAHGHVFPVKPLHVDRGRGSGGTRAVHLEHFL